MVDAGAASVNRTPQSITVDALRALPVPAGYDKYNDATRYAPERQIYTVQAQVLGWKVEADRDYHIVIAQPGSPTHTMIVESIDPGCPLAKQSVFAPAFASVRAAFASCHIAPTPRFNKCAIPVPVEIQGPAFFDPIHGQTGVAPNGIEIHPVLAIRSLACPK